MSTTTYYVARTVRVPPLVACAAYDDLGAESDVWHVDAGSAVLVIDGPASRGDAWTRATTASVRSSAGRMRVTLEIEPWSSERTQLGIRPERWGLRKWPPPAQMDAAHTALTHLADAVYGWADEPLRTLTQTWEVRRVSNVTDRLRSIGRWPG